MNRTQVTTLTCFATFVALGACGTLLGPSFQSLTRRYEMPLANGGIFTALQFGAVLVSVMTCGRLLDKVNPRDLFVGGLALMGCGLLLLAAAPIFPIAAVATLVLGFGIGALDVTPNVVIVSLYPDTAAASVNTLNLFFGLGAMLGPQLLNFALQQHNFTLAFIMTGIVALLLIPLAFVSVTTPPQPRSDGAAKVNWRAFLPFGIMMFAYVGVEVGFGSWVFTQLTKVALSTDSVGTIAASLFWVGVTVSRGTAGWVLRRVTDEQLIVYSAGVLGIGVLFMLLVPASQPVGLISALVVGLGCGPLFPTAFAIVTNTHPEVRGTVSGLLIAVGSIGAAVLPWVQGEVGGGTSGGMVVILVLAIIIVGLAVAVERQAQHAAT